jgi:hypothetical protein
VRITAKREVWQEEKPGAEASAPGFLLSLTLRAASVL